MLRLGKVGWLTLFKLSGWKGRQKAGLFVLPLSSQCPISSAAGLKQTSTWDGNGCAPPPCPSPAALKENWLLCALPHKQRAPPCPALPTCPWVWCMNMGSEDVFWASCLSCHCVQLPRQHKSSSPAFISAFVSVFSNELV